MAIKAINPATGKLIKEYNEVSLENAIDALKKTDAAFKEWKKTDFSERSKLMKKAGNILKDKKEEYGRLMAEEMGKPITQGEAESEKCAWVCDYYAENAEKFLQDELVETDAGKSYVAFEPLGTIMAIMPWNFPFWQVFRFAVPSIMAGNTGVLKHASNVPGNALAIEEVFREAGFPDNVFKTLLISSSTASSLISSDYVKAVTLTGSNAAGSKVAALAGENLKKMVLELGGSDPFIALSDVNVKTCVANAVSARTINTGQSCVAAKRFIVMEDIADKFEKEYKEKMESLVVGDPLDRKTEVGPMARQDLLMDLDKQVQNSIKKGAKLLTGGKRLDRQGFFYEPTVLSDVKKGMPAFEEELFGPVAAVIRVKDEDEAIKVANSTIYGLGASIWSDNTEKAEKLARRIEAGAVFVNGIVKSDPRMPFGGVKKSGYGRELSHYGIKEFVNIKTVWIR